MIWFDDALADGRLALARISMIDLAPPLLWRGRADPLRRQHA